VLFFFMALLASRGFDTPSLSAQGGQRRSRFLNIARDIPLSASIPASTDQHAPICCARARISSAVSGALTDEMAPLGCCGGIWLEGAFTTVHAASIKTTEQVSATLIGYPLPPQRRANS
jgi:hypothetical protein